ncbi:hypothetical protein AcW1_002544 [Taiwanofungus camphoratus]|nr:hypothetical protein AcV7_005401 [Antrodia cinnamomea]KAI0943368.1 hypothetical protein AcW1_002544 [Antrodia cinnamomea]
MTVFTSSRKKQKMARLPRVTDSEEKQFQLMDRTLARMFVQELVRRRTVLTNRMLQLGTYKPRMDMCDDPDNPHIVAILEVPGLKQEEVSVRVEDDKLVVQGERRFPSSSTAGAAVAPSEEAGVVSETARALPPSYVVQELKYGTYRRVIKLPLGTQTGQVQASLSAGMLTLSWPRNPGAENVNAGTGHIDDLMAIHSKSTSRSDGTL